MANEKLATKGMDERSARHCKRDIAMLYVAAGVEFQSNDEVKEWWMIKLAYIAKCAGFTLQEMLEEEELQRSRLLYQHGAMTRNRDTGELN